MHIFALNDTWLNVIKKLESFSTDASPLIEGIEIVINGKVMKDEIYEELMKQNEELDELIDRMFMGSMLFMYISTKMTAKRSAFLVELYYQP